MNSLRIFKKGEQLYKEGEKAQKIYIIQSGLVSVYLPRPKKSIELYQVTTSQILGEEAIFGGTTYNASAVSLNETKVFEIPVDILKAQIDTSSQLLKLLIKSISEKAKSSANEMKSYKLEHDSTPLPPDNVAKVFGVIFHTAMHTGLKKEDRVTVVWSAFKRYAQRVFLESPLRLEQASYLLTKLKLAEFEMTKDENDPNAIEELGYFHYLNLTAVERFFDFYQNYHFKGGNADILRSDDKCIQVVDALIKLSAEEKMDRSGVVYMHYKNTLDKLKEVIGPSFNPDVLSRIEQKGLFLKRASDEKGGILSFFRSEFEIMLQNWRILKEIEKWNEKGFVELIENDPAKMAAAPKNCPACSADVSPGQKFCGSCGTPLVAPSK